MATECYECADWVEEYGDSVCLGCYNKLRRKVEEMNEIFKNLSHFHLSRIQDRVNAPLCSFCNERVSVYQDKTLLGLVSCKECNATLNENLI